MAYPGIYRAKAVAVSGTQLSAYIPQVFGDVLVTVESFVGDPPTASVMGWVSFQGGNSEFPVWYGGAPAGTGAGTGTGNGSGSGNGLTVAQADLRYLMLAGGTMTGPLVLPPEVPATNNHASTKGYVDSQVSTRLTQADADARYVNVAGDTMIGPLTLPGLPTLDLHAATKSYVDTNIAAGAVPATRSILTTAPLTGGGDLTTNRTLAISTFTAAVKGAVPPPTTVTGKYLKDDGTWAVPSGTGLTQATADTLYVNATGDTMAGPLVLPGDPTLPLQATTKQYVDTRLTQAQADALYVNITGDSLTAGDLTLFRDPSTNMHAASKQYVDAQRDSRQPLDADLTTIAGLTATTGNMILSVSNAWASQTPVQVKTALSLNNVDNTSDANKPVSTAQAAANALRLLKAGDAMTGGDLTLFRDPSSAMHAATKQYVDTHLTQAEADPLYINVLGDTMSGQLTMNHDIVQTGASRKIVGRVLKTVNGGSSGSPAEAISFGYGGAEQYPFTILTEHHSTQNPGNKLHFRLWKVTDPIGGPSTNNVLTLAGDLITAYYAIALPADPTSALHAATKQYVDTHLTQAEADPLYVNVGGDTMGGTLNITTGNLNITAGQLLFGTRSGQHLMLSGTDHSFGVQGPSGGGQDTVYSRSPNAFYWYRGGVHDAVRGTPGLGGVALLAMSDTLFTYKGSKIWTAADDGHKADHTGINADRLDSKHAIEFANREEMEALLGDLLYAGLYDAALYDATDADATKPHPDWSGGPDLYRHGMYWVVNSAGNLDFIDSDASGRYEVGIDEEISVSNGDWVIATDPLFDPGVPAHDEGTDLPLSAMIFQYVPFSAETYVKSQILMHVAAEDPHAQYLRPEEADVVYSPKDHSHPGEIRQHLINHTDIAAWPVTGWEWEASTGVITLTVAARSGLPHSILPLGAFDLVNVHPDLNRPRKWPVLDVETASDKVRFDYGTTAPTGYTVPVDLTATPGEIHNDPHSQYLETKEADLLYAPVDHNHDLQYERLGEVEFHESKTDPHPQYLTEEDGDLLYLSEDEGTALYALKGHTHPEVLEVHATDGAVSADIWVGDVAPTLEMGLAIGDIWIETPPIELQAPSVHQLTVTNGASGTSVVASWQPWDSSEAVTEISLERSTTGTWPGTQLITDKNLTSYTDTGRAANTRYYYRILAKNPAGDGPYSTVVDIVTKPANPTVIADSTGYNNATATWAPTGVGTYTYDVWINSVLKWTDTTELSVAATGVVENTTYTFAVRAKSALSGLYSATISDAITTVNAVPLAPTGLADSAPTSSSLTLAWTASASADRKDYQVYRGTTNPPTTYVATTASTSYTFTGLSSSTLYYLSVRTRDTRDAVSALAPAVSGSTAAPADTAPPAAPTIQSFQPQTTYGTMVLNATLGAGTTQYRIDSSVNNSTWTIELNWTAHGAGAIPARTIGTYADGTTVYCRVYARDNAGNTTYANAASYTLITSPTYITATATNHWRANGTWNAMGTSRPVQGFYSNSSYNATGCWFYGTKPNTTLYYGNRRTITSGNIWLKRMDGGDGVDRDITIRVHTDASQPAGAPGVQGSAFDIDANLPWNGAGKWVPLPAGWADLLVTGSTYKGVALLKSTADNSTNYMTLANLSEDANSGKLQIHHLG